MKKRTLWYAPLVALVLGMGGCAAKKTVDPLAYMEPEVMQVAIMHRSATQVLAEDCTPERLQNPRVAQGCQKLRNALDDVMPTAYADAYAQAAQRKAIEQRAYDTAVQEEAVVRAHRRARLSPPAAAGTPVYSADECIGPVIMGVCHGSILSTNPMPRRCYGEMLNGQCTGPMF